MVKSLLAFYLSPEAEVHVWTPFETEDRGPSWNLYYIFDFHLPLDV